MVVEPLSDPSPQLCQRRLQEKPWWMEKSHPFPMAKKVRRRGQNVKSLLPPHYLSSRYEAGEILESPAPFHSKTSPSSPATAVWLDIKHLL